MDDRVLDTLQRPSRLEQSRGDVVERTLQGSYGYRTGPLARAGEFATTIRLLEEGQFDADWYITDRIPLTDIVSDGFEALLNPTSEHVKILVEPA